MTSHVAASYLSTRSVLSSGWRSRESAQWPDKQCQSSRAVCRYDLTRQRSQSRHRRRPGDPDVVPSAWQPADMSVTAWMLTHGYWGIGSHVHEGQARKICERNNSKTCLNCCCGAAVQFDSVIKACHPKIARLNCVPIGISIFLLMGKHYRKYSELKENFQTVRKRN